MELIKFDREEPYIKMFLDLPKRLYGKQELMQQREEEERLLRGTHDLNHYVKLTGFLVADGADVLARCIVTEYPEDLFVYFGFFECVSDEAAFHCLMDGVERFVMDRQYTAIEGPLDVSLWIRYRFKANLFERPPYFGEPYNKDYYLSFFAGRHYTVRERYVSNRYRALPKKDFALPVYQKRYETFRSKGYEIRSPKPEEWDRCIGEIYDMIAVLYRNFLTYHAITKEEFTASYNAYRPAVDYDLIKIAYYHGEAVGFFMGVPDYGNLTARKRTLPNILRFLQTKRHPKQYVLLYMGVMPEHRGIGKALTHCIMEELAKKSVPSIGSLIRYNNPNFDYAKEYMTERYEYHYLEKKFTISDYLRRGEGLWSADEYILEKTENGWLSYSFGRFAGDVRKCAHWLADQGFSGKNIGLYGANSYAWMVLDISIMGYTGVSVPIDAQYRETELANLLDAADVSVLFYSVGQSETVAAVQKNFACVTFIRMEEIPEKYAGYSTKDDLPYVPPERVVKIMYTSGTAAAPKGVMLSQANMFSNWKALFCRTPMTHEDSIYLVLPLNHVYAGVAAFLYTLVSGMKICLGTPSPQSAMEDFRELKPSVFIGVPLLAERMWEIAGASEDRKNAFGGRLKYFYCGGTAVSPELKNAYIEAGIPFLEAYGLTETSSVVALDIAGDYRTGSVGVVMESVEAVIDRPDETGVGELLVRGGSVMPGYCGMPERNREILDERGFFHTGDLARLDESRHLYLTGRKRRMLLTGNGKNVYPEEIEHLICRHPNINRATLYQRENELHLKVWYLGREEGICRFVEQTRDKLPKYMRYRTYECIKDDAGRRLK